MLLSEARSNCFGVAIVAALFACTTEKPSSRPVAAVDSAPRLRTPSPDAWDTAFGPLIGYGGDSTIVVLLPEFNYTADTTFDAAKANGSRVDLFDGKGIVGNAVISGLGKSSDDGGCFEYSRGKLDQKNLHWSVALPAGRATPIPMRELSELRGADSVAFVREIVALAETAPEAADSEWIGQPYMVEGAASFSLGATSVIAASGAQMISGPGHFARQFFVVGERAAADSAGNYTLAYRHPQGHSRPNATNVSGLDAEDEVGVDAALFMKSNSQPTMILETHGSEVNGYAALGRVAPGRWGVVWDGPHEGGC